MSLVEVKVPDIGDFESVPVIELFVKVGDNIAVDDPICTLESDKATMDVPSSSAGVVKEVLINVGDKVAEGSVLIKLEAGASAGAPAADASRVGAGQGASASSSATARSADQKLAADAAPAGTAGVDRLASFSLPPSSAPACATLPPSSPGSTATARSSAPRTAPSPRSGR